jgi:hypothetical protein
MQALFTDSEVQGFILAPGLHLGCVFARKASGFGRPHQKFGAKLAINWENEDFNKDFGSLMPSLSSTLNVEP